MNIHGILSNRYLRGGVLLLAGLALGWMLFHTSPERTRRVENAMHEHVADEHDEWTCAMHPQIRMDEPGLCPICGMDLIPVQGSGTGIDEQAIGFSQSALKLAEVQTAVANPGRATREVQLYGKIRVDERLVQSQAAHIPGRIEVLNVNVTGEQVSKGQLLAKLYSPELVSTRKEMLEALELKDRYPALLEAAREKLRNWKFTDSQIAEMENPGNINPVSGIFATTTGLVLNRRVSEGEYVDRGKVLFDIADLSRVWAVFDAYESDLAWIKTGQKISFTTAALPGRSFSGVVTFIDPVFDPLTRTAGVRVELPNPGGVLKPEMFVNGTLRSEIQGDSNKLVIPRSSVLWTGKRSLVYVRVPGSEPVAFRVREVILGPSAGEYYLVESGLTPGEEIVTNGTFSVDAAAQLAGKPSMMNPVGGISGTGHDHGSPAITDKVKHADQPTGYAGGGSVTGADHEHTEFRVEGNCGMCKDRIESAARSANGVSMVVWDPDTKILHLSYDSKITSLAKIHETIALAGHDTDMVKAPDEVYENLPECCLYRK